MKEKKQVSSPCTKKGLGTGFSSSCCKCLPECKNLGGYAKLDSIGTLKYNVEENSNFIGCIEVDEFLIEHKLIRYHLRETTGLEVLFSGIEKIPSLYLPPDKYDLIKIINNPEHIHNEAEFLESISQGEDSALFKANSESDLFSAELEDNGDLIFTSDRPGFSQSLSCDIFATRPTNLTDSFFRTLYARGLFTPKCINIENETLPYKRKREQKESDLFIVATCLINKIDSSSATFLTLRRFSA